MSKIKKAFEIITSSKTIAGVNVVVAFITLAKTMKDFSKVNRQIGFKKPDDPT